MISEVSPNIPPYTERNSRRYRQHSSVGPADEEKYLKLKHEDSILLKRLQFLKHKLLQKEFDQNQPNSHSEYQDREFVQNSMNLVLTEDSLKILSRYKDFHKLNGIEEWRNIQQSMRTSPKLG